MTEATLTISGTGFNTIILGYNPFTLTQPDGHSQPPMPTDYSVTYERAIVEHEPIGTEYSIGQDMGSHSIKIDLTGICFQGDLTNFKSIATLNQFAASKGPVTLALVGSGSIQSWSYAGCVLKSFAYKPTKGSKVYYDYTAKFVQYNSQS